MFKFLTYNKFKINKWKRLSPTKRLKVFQKLENIEAKTYNRKPNTVIVDNLNGTNGIFYDSNKVIKIDVKFVYETELRFMGMFTIFHEGRHAFQTNAVNKPKLSIFSKAYHWKKNMEGYINSNEDKYSFYSMQPIERDANLYAIKRLNNFRFRYKNEPNFKQTLESKKEEFEYIKQNAKKELGIFYRIRVAFKSFRKRNKK